MIPADHEVDIILRVDAVTDRAQEPVGIWRKVYTSGVGLGVKNGSNEGQIFMRETIMFLASPGTGLEVVDGGSGARKLVSSAILTNFAYWTIIVCAILVKAS